MGFAASAGSVFVAEGSGPQPASRQTTASELRQIFRVAPVIREIWRRLFLRLPHESKDGLTYRSLAPGQRQPSDVRSSVVSSMIDRAIRGSALPARFPLPV